jgi:hypothetical protein
MSDQTPPPPPSYGAPVAHPGAVPPNHPKAVLSLVLGILSYVCCGIFTAVPAYIIGKKTEREIIASNGTLGGAGLAKAGWILGLVAMILFALGVVLWIILFATGAISTTVDTSTTGY